MRISFLSRRASYALALVVGSLLSIAALAQLGGTSGVILPYSGHLELDGEPVNSLTPVTFRFTLWSAATGGTACAPTYTETSDVRGGRFSVEIGPIAESCVLGREVHLAVEVNNGEGFTALAGRQRVYPALGAMTSGTGDLFVAGELDAAGALSVADDLDVGGDAFATRLRLSSVSDLSPTSTAHGFMLGPQNGTNLAMDSNEIMARNNGAPSAIYLNNDGGDVHVGDSNSAVQVPGDVTAGDLTVSGLAKGMVRGGGTRRCSSNSAILLGCTAWGTGACAPSGGTCGGESCSKGTVTFSTGLTACYDGGLGNYTAGCISWVCVE